MKQALIAALGVLFFLNVSQAETYEFDPGYTEIRFYYDAQGLTTQSGEPRQHQAAHTSVPFGSALCGASEK